MCYQQRLAYYNYFKLNNLLNDCKLAIIHNLNISTSFLIILMTSGKAVLCKSMWRYSEWERVVIGFWEGFSNWIRSMLKALWLILRLFFFLIFSRLKALGFLRSLYICFVYDLYVLRFQPFSLYLFVSQYLCMDEQSVSFFLRIDCFVGTGTQNYFI